MCDLYGIPERMLLDKEKQMKFDIVRKKPRPNPLLHEEYENVLKEWVFGMQKQGLPVTRMMILTKANEIYHSVYGNTRSVGNLSQSWINKFFSRHPDLSIRSSQAIKRCRNEANLMVYVL